MRGDDEGLNLSALLPAAELAQLRRRVAFLEAAVSQLLRGEGQLREWFSAGDLAELRLPGLPQSASGIAKQARRERWHARISRRRSGETILYHYAALPRHAFAGLLDLVLRGALPSGGQAAPVRASQAAPAVPPPIRTADGGRPTPRWVLPLMRLIRGGAPTIEEALRRLPEHLPAAAERPTLAEAKAELRRLGFHRR